MHKFRVYDDDGKIYHWLVESGIPSNLWTYSKDTSNFSDLVSLYIHDNELSSMVRLTWSDRITWFSEIKRYVTAGEVRES